MDEQQSRLFIPRRVNKRTYSKDHQKRPLNSTQDPSTPTALFNTFKAPRSLDHIHEFRRSCALPSNTNDNKNSSGSLPHLTLAKSTPLHTTNTNNSSTASLQPSLFVCFVCHTWICISSSTYRRTCTCDNYATHHYHAKGTWTTSQEYECCGCGNHIEMSYHDAVVSTNLLSKLFSTRALEWSHSDSTEQATPKPTMLSTVTTCQRYISDLLGNTRRNINTQNRHFIERIGLDDTALQLLGIIGFNYRDGYLYAPDDVDNNRLCMIHEELGASLVRMASMAKKSVNITEVDYPPADSTILDDLLGRRDSVENVSFSIETGLDDLYAKLGVTSSAADELILWAYRRMALEQPDHIQDLLEALENIAAIGNSDFLQTESAMERSKEGTAIRNKNVDKAYQYFGAQKDIDDETIIAAHRYKKQDFPRGESTHDEKLRIIGESRKSEVILQYLESESASSGGQYRNRYQTGQSRNSPVGLTNIGNTCYLNSLLQYYYTLTPFRNTIINMNDYVENEDSVDWQGKKLGGIQVDQKEVKRAKKFMALLQNIFIQLEHTSDYTIAPEMELAKMALFNEKKYNVPDNNGSNISNAKVGDSSNVLDESKIISSMGGDSSCNDNNDNNTTERQHAPLSSDMNASHRPNQNTELDATNPLNTSNVQVNEMNQQHSHLDSVSAEQTDDMNTMMLGKQQDVTECMDNVTYLVEAALKSQGTGEATQAKNVIRDLFYGKARQILSYKDDNTTKNIEKVMEEDFSHVIVDAKKGKTLYDGLDEHYFAEKVESFQGGQEATREVTVQRFPPILQIQIQRAQFNRYTNQVYKSNAFIQFDDIIYLDRYLDSNFQTLAPRRKKVAMWRNQLAQCQHNAKGQSVKVNSNASTPVDIPVPWLLEKAASILDGFELDSSHPKPADLANSVGQLNQEALSIKNTLKESMKQANEYETKIKNEYSDLTDCAYQLHAVFMHKGEANYGHYWLYILDHKTGCWWKFNDSLVTKVKETEIFKDTSGTQSNPYFLVYIKKVLVDSLAAVSQSGD